MNWQNRANVLLPITPRNLSFNLEDFPKPEVEMPTVQLKGRQPSEKGVDEEEILL